MAKHVNCHKGRVSRLKFDIDITCTSSDPETQCMMNSRKRSQNGDGEWHQPTKKKKYVIK